MEHYSEDGNNYEDEIADLMDLRQVSYSDSLTYWKTKIEFFLVSTASDFTDRYIYYFFFPFWL